MKTIFLVFAIVVMVAGVAHAGYNELTAEQKVNVDAAALAAGYTDPVAYYDMREAQIIAEIPAQLRNSKIRIIRKALGSLTDEQITQIEAIINP